MKYLLRRKELISALCLILIFGFLFFIKIYQQHQERIDYIDSQVQRWGGRVLAVDYSFFNYDQDALYHVRYQARNGKIIWQTVSFGNRVPNWR